ncbi:MAG: O-phosphoserine--tRNA ligase [Candidatus Woesearchaeota archaeon]
MFDVQKIKEQASKDFEKTWRETVDLIPKNTSITLGKGKPNLFRDMVERCRKLLIEMGFCEMENKTMIPADEVYLQYGPEAPVILDRAYYLAKLPRPDIGLSDDKIRQIEEIIGEFDSDVLREILRSYKKGDIEGDDFVEELVVRLGIPTDKATLVVEEVFHEFKELSPQPTSLTLRTHMTGAWYKTLAALQDHRDFPLALFSVGPRYRNEQKEDNGHLRVHNSASMVIMDPDMSLEAGKEIVKQFLLKLGFSDVCYEVKKGTSKYYAKDLEEEAFVKIGDKWLEIGDIGMYSVISLAQYGIKYPVFNAGFGVERLCMVLNSISDIRELVYPQFGKESFSDEEIAHSVYYVKEPQTERGKMIADGVEAAARACKDMTAPCEKVAYEDSTICVKLQEKEEGKKLLGPACMNELYVKDGCISCKEGIPVNKSIIQALSKAVARETEITSEDFTYNVKIAKSLPQVNMQIPREVSLFIQQKQYTIDVSGPVFMEVEIHYK